MSQIDEFLEHGKVKALDEDVIKETEVHLCRPLCSVEDPMNAYQLTETAYAIQQLMWVVRCNPIVWSSRKPRCTFADHCAQLRIVLKLFIVCIENPNKVGTGSLNACQLPQAACAIRQLDSVSVSRWIL